jgi:manganese-transporting P-type ATPase
MPPKVRPRVDELIQSISLHTPIPVAFHGTIFPFLFLYGSWFYFWVFVYGVSDYYEAGLVTLVGIAIVQIFTCLCCFWSVHFRVFTSCRKVSWNFERFLLRLDVPLSLTCYPFLEQITVARCSREGCADRKQRFE